MQLFSRLRSCFKSNEPSGSPIINSTVFIYVAQNCTEKTPLTSRVCERKMLCLPQNGNGNLHCRKTSNTLHTPVHCVPFAPCWIRRNGDILHPITTTTTGATTTDPLEMCNEKSYQMCVCAGHVFLLCLCLRVCPLWRPSALFPRHEESFRGAHTCRPHTTRTQTQCFCKDNGTMVGCCPGACM